MMLLVTTITRKKKADPQTVRAKKAYEKLKTDLKKAGHLGSDQLKTDMILDALRHYLGARLRMPDKAIVFNDACRILSEKGTSGEVLDSLRSIFETCESDRYSGMSGSVDHATLSEKTLNTVKKLESVFK